MGGRPCLAPIPHTAPLRLPGRVAERHHHHHHYYHEGTVAQHGARPAVPCLHFAPAAHQVRPDQAHLGVPHHVRHLIRVVVLLRLAGDLQAPRLRPASRTTAHAFGPQAAARCSS